MAEPGFPQQNAESVALRLQGLRALDAPATNGLPVIVIS
jgi:hypothetical protein